MGKDCQYYPTPSVSLLTYYFLFCTSPFYIRTYPSHILLFRLCQPCLIPVTMLYPHTTVLFIDLLCVPLISVSLLTPTVGTGFPPDEPTPGNKPTIYLKYMLSYMLVNLNHTWASQLDRLDESVIPVEVATTTMKFKVQTGAGKVVT